VDAGSGEPTLAFEGSVGFLLSRAGALARRSWAAMLADHALTPHQYGVLMTIAEVGPVGQQQLSGLIGVDPRNIVPVVDGLAERQLLARGVDPDDRRRRILTLTTGGRDVVADLTRAGSELERQFLGPLSSDEQGHLQQLLAMLLGAPRTP
jgi:DNA-binding MarR family transcriptional regulator